MTLSVYRWVEIILYSLVSFLPFFFLTLTSFRNQFRFSGTINILLIVLACFVQIALDLVAAIYSISPGIVLSLGILVYFIFSLLIIKAQLGKLLFTLFVLTNVINLVLNVSKYLEELFFGDIALELCRWSFTLCIVFVHLLVTLPVFFYVHFRYAKAMDTPAFFWNFLWLIPGFFFLIWYQYLTMSNLKYLETILSEENLFFLIVINLEAFIVYHAAVLLFIEKKKAQELAVINHHLNLHKLQYDNLQSRINEARQAKHDVRHHAHLIREYLNNGMLQELDAYLESYTASLPSTQSLIHCQHYATNVLLEYFVQQAQIHNIDIDVFVQLPAELKLPDTTLSVVLSNLLENAIEACCNMKEGDKKITIRGKAEQGVVFFEITNTFNGELRRTITGKLLSTKSSSRGLGLDSVSQLVALRGGMLEIDPKNGIFRVSVLLHENRESYK